MIPERRDAEGRLKVPYFIALLEDYMERKSGYTADEFKHYVEGLDVLRPADWETEQNGYVKWKHRVDRAAQKVFTDI
jgi:hypothetical protein